MNNMSSYKKMFWVSIPITGMCSFEVEADDECAAKDAAWGLVNEGNEGELMWEYTERVVSGNIFHGMQNEIEVQEQ